MGHFLVGFGSPGYEPKGLKLCAMDSIVVRRRATKEELEQGMKDMEESQKKIDAENRIRGEEPNRRPTKS